MRIRDIMKTKVKTIKPGETVAFAKELFRRFDIHHLVVVEKNAVIGLLADRDLMDTTDDTAVQEVMTDQPVTITPDETVRKAAALMTGKVIGSLPVVEDGKLVGIVTTFDLLELLAKGATHPAPAAERPGLAKRGPRKRPLLVGGQPTTPQQPRSNPAATGTRLGGSNPRRGRRT